MGPLSVVSRGLQDGSRLLGEQQAETFLHGHTVPGELVVRREAGRVGRAGGLAQKVHFLGKT